PRRRDRARLCRANRPLLCRTRRACRRARPAGGARLVFHTAPSRLCRRRTSSAEDPVSARLSGSASRFGIRTVSRHLDRPAAQERHHPNALRSLDFGTGRTAATATLVHYPQRAALGEVSVSVLLFELCE